MRASLSLLVASLAALPAVRADGEKPATPPADPAKHWAFKAPMRPAVPAASANPIDAFILDRLQREMLKASPEADKVTLCRRLYLDLLGLPPSPKQVDEFLADTGADAYGKLVEKLLASPHFGERQARIWMDAARYADSDGYEKDKSRQVWMYRDWLVKAFNDDLPYDQFIIHQLAGDLLPNAAQDQIVATGFLRMSMLNEEGGVDPEQFRMDAMFDRMDAVGKAFLGLSLACCQCHDHKFDPISQEEYYRVFAFLNNDYEAQRVTYTPAEWREVQRIRDGLKKLTEEVKHTHANWAEQLAKWEAATAQSLPKWSTVKVENASDNSQRYFPQADGSILAQGYAPTKFSTLMRGPSPVKTIHAFRLELLNDANLPCNGPGRSFMGTCALTEFGVEVEQNGKREKIKIAKAFADYSNPERELEKNFDDQSKKKRVTGPVTFAIDGKDDTAWGIDAGPGRRNEPRQAVFIPEKPIELPAGAILHFSLKQNHGGWNSDDHMNNNLGRFRLSVSEQPVAEGDPLPLRVQNLLGVKRTDAQTEIVVQHWQAKAMREKAEALWKQWPAGSTSLVVQSREMPRTTHLLKRGNFLKPGDEVIAGVPAFLHPLPEKSAPDRLTFAKWVADKRSPTTARAFVNRVWQSYFGTGLMNTPEEFGTQGEKPTHPELLDWLAVEFMEPKQGPAWSMKHLHRLIVNSSTYKQSSKVTPELLAKDPQNRLLARGPRFRVDGEIVRDIALSASGLLNPQMGGPSVFTPAPAFLFQRPVSYGPFEWIEAKGDERYRRGLYTFRRRSTPYPALTVFDAPIGEQSCVKRTRTNTPLQALTGLNETIFVECARALGKRALAEGGATDADRVAYAFRLCTSRKPSAEESAVLLGLLNKYRDRFKADLAAAAEVATGDKKSTATAEQAAYVLVARVLLNLDETIAKE
ncbi:MAG: DUF1549 and DUF1553 domain-containing protein [Gemmataceae bacterium]